VWQSLSHREWRRQFNAVRPQISFGYQPPAAFEGKAAEDEISERRWLALRGKIGTYLAFPTC
jgi:hypothetical protein